MPALYTNDHQAFLSKVSGEFQLVSDKRKRKVKKKSKPEWQLLNQDVILATK